MTSQPFTVSLDGRPSIAGGAVTLTYVPGLEVHVGALDQGFQAVTIDLDALGPHRWLVRGLLGHDAEELAGDGPDAAPSQLPAATSDLRAELGRLAVAIDLARIVPVGHTLRAWLWLEAVGLAGRCGSGMLLERCVTGLVDAMDKVTQDPGRLPERARARVAPLVERLDALVSDQSLGHRGLVPRLRAVARGLSSPVDDESQAIGLLRQGIRSGGLADSDRPGVKVTLDASAVDTLAIDPTRPMRVEPGTPAEVVVPLHPGAMRATTAAEHRLYRPDGTALEAQPRITAEGVARFRVLEAEPDLLVLRHPDARRRSGVGRGDWLARFAAHEDRSALAPTTRAEPFLAEAIMADARRVITGGTGGTGPVGG